LNQSNRACYNFISATMVVFIIGGGVARGAATSPAPDEWKAYMTSGAAQEALKRFDAAAELYLGAFRVARTQDERIEASLARAGLLSRVFKPQTKRLAEIDELYRSAIDGAVGDLSLRASNDYGVFLLRQGNTDRAIRVLGGVEGQVQTSTLSAVVRSRYFFNYARALERAGREEEASERYFESMKLDSTFQPARSAALRLAEAEVKASPQSFRASRTSIINILSTSNVASSGKNVAAWKPPEAANVSWQAWRRASEAAAEVVVGPAIKDEEVAGDEKAENVGRIDNVRQRSARGLLRIIDLFLVQGDLEKAEASLRGLLKNPDCLDTEGHVQLLELLVRYWTSARVSPEEFATSWTTSLDALGDIADSASRVQEVREAYLGDLPLEAGAQATSAFPEWEISGQAFSAFVEMIGDAYATSGNRRRALERYSQAFVLNPANTDACLYMVNLLSEYQGELDPKGGFFDELVGGLPSTLELSEGRDLGDVARLHFLIAAALESRANLGPEESPRGAIFHWRRALEAEQQISLASNIPLKAISMLHEKLGGAYLALGNAQEAVQQDLRGAEEYEALKDEQGAQLLLARAAGIQAQERPLPAETAAEIAHADFTPSAESTMASLPKTASSEPLVGLLGVISIGAALRLRIQRLRSVGS